MLLGVVVELVQVVERNELVVWGTLKITRINVIANVGVPKEQPSSPGWSGGGNFDHGTLVKVQAIDTVDTYQGTTHHDFGPVPAGQLRRGMEV